jgi:DNA-binding CsgD family transcriptional regulator
MPRLAEVVLTDDEREVLERWARRPKSAQALALRCRIVLAAADGRAEQGDRDQLFFSPRTVEWHLRKVVMKLGISSRRKLRSALPDGSAATVPA